MADTVLSTDLSSGYREEAPPTDFQAFKTIVESRRSVRKFEDVPIPDEVVEEILELGLLAPNSSNLQPWEFYWIKSPEVRKKMIPICFNQNAVKTASVIIVACARPNMWRAHSKQMMKEFEKQGPVLPAVKSYYTKLAPLIYSQGPLGLWGQLKRVIFGVLGLFRMVPRFPFGRGKLEVWAQKSVALACENIMLGFRAAGFDSCPMEGFDERRLKELLHLPRDTHVTMVIGAGKRSPDGVYNPRLRFPKEEFIKRV